MLKVLLSAGLLLTGLAYSARAQVQVKFESLQPARFSYGLRAGGHVMGLHPLAYDRLHEAPQTGLWGGNAGLAAEVSWGWLAVQPSMVFTQKGFRTQDSWTETHNGKTLSLNSLTRLRLNYLEVPINLVATVHGFQLLAGPYVSVGLNGRFHDEATLPMGSEYGRDYTTYQTFRDEKVYFSEKGRNYDDIVVRRVDAGFNLGLGYRYKGWQLQPTYSRGIRYTGFGYQTKNWNAQLNLTRFFGAGA
ncbi:outer membrane beta-barrel protein [Hymenobacter sp. 102]|uniref:outer membrane beta-barrel protein n=1 Tax=Hymenobacter sp. 102 TaxID=3403152 RepID=UPI003CF30507